MAGKKDTSPQWLDFHPEWAPDGRPKDKSSMLTPNGLAYLFCACEYCVFQRTSWADKAAEVQASYKPNPMTKITRLSGDPVPNDDEPSIPSFDPDRPVIDQVDRDAAAALSLMDTLMRARTIEPDESLLQVTFHDLNTEPKNGNVHTDVFTDYQKNRLKVWRMFIIDHQINTEFRLPDFTIGGSEG